MAGRDFSFSESGNVFFFILLAIVLIGLVTVAIRGTGEDANIDRESIIIGAAQVRQYVSDLERGIAFIMHDGASENELRFAHPRAPAAYGAIADTPNRQVFSDEGGAVDYRLPPADISGAAHWEFYANTHLPDIGDNTIGLAAPELIAMLPDVSLGFCEKINEMNGLTGQPAENGDCNIHDTAMRFSSAVQYQDGAPNTVDATSFSATPAMQACIECSGTYHFYHVLLAR